MVMVNAVYKKGIQMIKTKDDLRWMLQLTPFELCKNSPIHEVHELIKNTRDRDIKVLAQRVIDKYVSCKVAVEYGVTVKRIMNDYNVGEQTAIDMINKKMV